MGVAGGPAPAAAVASPYDAQGKGGGKGREDSPRSGSVPQNYSCGTGSQGPVPPNYSCETDSQGSAPQNYSCGTGSQGARPVRPPVSTPLVIGTPERSGVQT